MWNVSSVWTLHVGAFHSLSLFPSDMELKAFLCVRWQLLAPPLSWGTISMKRRHWVSRRFSLACQIVFQANPTCSFSLGWIWFPSVSWDIYVRFCCFRMQAFLFHGILSKCEVDHEDDKTLLLNYLFSFCLIPCSFLVGGRGRDLLLMGCQAVHHITSVECTHGERSCSGPGASLDKPLPFQIPSRMTFPFPVLLITPLEGIWSLECLWCFLLVMPEPLQETTGSLQPVQMGF